MKRCLAAAWIVLTAFAAHAQTRWEFPVTIEALQDVPAHGAEAASQRRGILYIGAAEPFTIKKGERFQMVKTYSEGGCRIQFENRQYDVSSCPWMDGFTDHQVDIFRVVQRRLKGVTIYTYR
jgi:hypothetical protein